MADQVCRCTGYHEMYFGRCTSCGGFYEDVAYLGHKFTGEPDRALKRRCSRCHLWFDPNRISYECSGKPPLGVRMSNFVDEPPTFKERFDAIETVLAIQRKWLEEIEYTLRVYLVEQQEPFGEKLWADREMFKADVDAIKKAIGIVILGLSGQPVNVGPDLMERLGFKTSSIVPASVITKAS